MTTNNYINKLGKYLIFSCLLSGLVMTGFAPAIAKTRQKDSTPVSNKFFSFDQADYYTSPDKRIGVKVLVDSAKVGSAMASLVHVTFLPGAHIKSHRHVYVTEVLYVLKGNLTFRIGNETRVMGPGTVAFIPPQTFHEYLNDSTDIVQFIQYFSPAGPEKEYRNWEKVGRTPVVTAIEKEEPKRDELPMHIIAPPQQVVPGSPLPRVDDRIIEADKPGSARDQNLELKLPDRKITPRPRTN